MKILLHTCKTFIEKLPSLWACSIAVIRLQTSPLNFQAFNTNSPRFVSCLQTSKLIVFYSHFINMNVVFLSLSMSLGMLFSIQAWLITLTMKNQLLILHCLETISFTNSTPWRGGSVELNLFYSSPRFVPLLPTFHHYSAYVRAKSVSFSSFYKLENLLFSFLACLKCNRPVQDPYSRNVYP